MNEPIKCPNCGQELDVEAALSGKLRAHLQAEYEQKIAQSNQIINKEKEQLSQQRLDFEEKKKRENELFQQRLQDAVTKEKSLLQTKIKADLDEQNEQKILALQEENKNRKEENIKLRQKEIELLQRENELKEKAEDLNLNIQKELLERQAEIEEKAKNKERESMALKEKEYQKKLDDQKKLIDEMKRKAEQGSTQLQGEVQELALEHLLQSIYPFDEISEVAKGIRGADCIQKVVNTHQQYCGNIVYESKRTKTFSNDWIDKLKQDQIDCKADIAVIVTEVMPSGMSRFGMQDKVWICRFEEVSSVSLALREMLIRTHAIKISQENKGDKMELLYSYLTSNEFTQNIQRIVENYDEMSNQLRSEKRAMQRIWAQREKQIEGVTHNLSAMFGAIKGIAGNDLGSASSLMELSTGIDND